MIFEIYDNFFLADFHDTLFLCKTKKSTKKGPNCIYEILLDDNLFMMSK